MREARRLWVHVLLLVVASVAAYVMAQPDRPGQSAPKPGEVDVWTAKPDQVARIRYEGKRQNVTLDRKSDDTGAYYLGQVEPVVQPPEPATEPDAGKKPKPQPKPVEAATFVSVKTADRIVEKLAPLRAKRAIGQVAADRAAAFGLDEPEGKLMVDVAGKKHTLVIGGRTPGASHRYVRDEVSNEVYVVDAAIVRDLDGGAARLAERSLHEWRIGEVNDAKIAAGDKTRQVIRGGTVGRRFWADPSSPDTNDETAGNWLSKVTRMRPVKFIEKLPEGANKIVRVDYTGKSGALGFLELYQAGDEFFITTEQLRLYATVAKTLGEQVRDDLTSLFDGGGAGEGGGDAGEESPAGSASATQPAPSSATPTAPPGNPHGGHGKGDGHGSGHGQGQGHGQGTGHGQGHGQGAGHGQGHGQGSGHGQGTGQGKGQGKGTGQGN